MTEEAGLSRPHVENAASHVERTLSRIAVVEPEVCAFTSYDPHEARRRAAEIDAASNPGPLAGLTLGIKDIIDTVHYPTRHGSPIYAQHQPDNDASCVSQLVSAGAIPIGKTVTTEFAFFTPGPTRNPHDLRRTPGGSSSGSAAAVATSMVDLALGSQTAASITRPASYCGVVGFKPSFGSYSLSGVKGLAPSFDTLGVIARDVSCIAAAHAVLASPVPAQVVRQSSAPSRIGLCHTPWWNAASRAMQQALIQTGERLADHAAIEPVSLDEFAEIADVHARIMAFEAAQSLTSEWLNARDRLSLNIRTLIETGRGITLSEHKAALAAAEEARRRADVLFDRFDLLIAPAAPGEAPEGLERTGDPIFSRLWTLLRLPSATLPVATGPTGLPLGVQFLGRLEHDEFHIGRLLWAESVLPARIPPRL